MSVVIYLHGFLSGPESTKAQIVKRWIKENRSDIQYHCPRLSSYPGQARDTLADLMRDCTAAKPMLVGSSLGGYWATWLSETYGLPAVLVNPAVRPSMLLPELIGVEVKNYYTNESYIFKEEDIASLREVGIAKITQPDNYWLMVQTGDETLDYKLALDKYQECRQLVEEAGNHSFEKFERWVPSIIAFLERRRGQLFG